MYHKQFVFTNKIEEVEKLPGILEELHEAVAIPPAMEASLNLAIEEALVNVIQYAYPQGTEGRILLDIDWEEERQTLRFTLTDQGTHFDPTMAPDAISELSLQERPIGGLRIFLIRQIMDRIEYNYQNQSNIMVMEKKISL